MTILGIDPGAHGAIAVLDAAGDLLAVHDMPHTVETNGRVATNAALLTPILGRPTFRPAKSIRILPARGRLRAGRHMPPYLPASST